MKRLVQLYGGFQFFFGLLFWLPIFYDYQIRIGLSPAEILAIQSLYQVVFCLVEVPTGWFADRFGYLSSLRWGAGILIFSNLLPIFTPNYQGFLIHFLLIALSRSFISGASSAYLYEALRARKMSDRYSEIEGSTRSFSLLGKVAGWAGVGALMEWHLTAPYWMTVVAALFALICAWCLPKIEAVVTTATKSSELFLSAAFQELKSNRLLLLVIFQGTAIFVLSRVAQVTLFQPILNEKAVPTVWHGLVMSAMTVFEALGSWKTNFLKRWISHLNAVNIMTLVLAATLGGMVFAGSNLTVGLLCLFSLAVGLSFPVQKQVMNDVIGHAGLRATLLSAESIVNRSVSALLTLVMASYLSQGRLNDFLIQTAGVTVLTTLAIAWLVQRERQKLSSLN